MSFTNRQSRAIVLFLLEYPHGYCRKTSCSFRLLVTSIPSINGLHTGQAAELAPLQLNFLFDDRAMYWWNNGYYERRTRCRHWPGAAATSLFHQIEVGPKSVGGSLKPWLRQQLSITRFWTKLADRPISWKFGIWYSLTLFPKHRTDRECPNKFLTTKCFFSVSWPWWLPVFSTVNKSFIPSWNDI